MRRMVIEMPDEPSSAYTVLTEHENGYSYEFMNFETMLDTKKLQEALDGALRDFNRKHVIKVRSYLDKDKLIFERAIQAELDHYEKGSLSQEFIKRLFSNYHKSKSKIVRLLIHPAEIFEIKEGQLKS